MKTRFATHADADSIVENNMKLDEEIEKIIFDKEKVKQGILQLLKNPARGFYLLVEEKKQIIGQVLITYEWSDWRNRPIWWMHRVYVSKSYRRKGVFSLMKKMILEMAEKQNVFAIRLYMHEMNTTAQIIYQKINFKKTPFLIYQQVLES